jgi:5-methylthioadenosine/S-adenosylhomocysteine deaminase
VFVYHCAEGQRGSGVAAEFHDLDATGWLEQAVATIHAGALEPADFRRWDAAGGRPGAGHPGGTVVWSPFSNLWLYGQTTLVPDAVAAGVGVALGTDWGPSGTRNLLGELKVARLWSDHEAWGLTDHDLVRMVTCVPGDLLGRVWQTPVGRLTAGGLGDVTVLARTDPDPWRSVVHARERDVQLVVVNGRAAFGRSALLRGAGERKTTSVPVGGGQRRSVALVRPDDTTRAWAWTDVLDRLNQVRHAAAATPPAGPAGAAGGLAAARAPLVGDPPGTPGFAVSLDMPGPGSLATAGPPPQGRTVQIAPIPPLYHDRAMFSFVRSHGFHGGVLDDLGTLFGVA